VSPLICRGIALLREYDFTYDILIYPRHLTHAKEFVRRFPGQPFVIDHLAKPFIRDKKIDEWKKDMEAIAEVDNVYCKLSGMVTEADWRHWKLDDFKMYIDTVIESFGPGRIMFGSDWPVCLIAAEYKEVCEVLEENIDYLSEVSKERLWGGNAERFYRL